MTARALLVALVLAFPTRGPAATSSAPGLSVWPARLALAPGETATLHLSNASRRPAVLGAGVAGFALDLRGTPRVIASSGGTSLLALRPARLVVPAGGTATLAVRALAGARLGPGDHPALVLLSARSGGGAGVGVRLRIGVTVEVRVPGVVRRRVDIARLRVRGRTATLLVVNRGNVAERVTRSGVFLRVLRRGRVLAALRPRPRDLLPHTSGLLEFPLPRRLHGQARVVVAATAIAGGRRTFSVSF